MKLYLAGNFAQLSKKENEMVMVNHIKNNGFNYNRLITYFFPKYCSVVISIKKDLKGETNEDC